MEISLRRHFHFVSLLSLPSPSSRVCFPPLASLTCTPLNPDVAICPQNLSFPCGVAVVCDCCRQGFSVRTGFISGAVVKREFLSSDDVEWGLRSKSKVCTLSVLFAQTRILLEKFRLFCFYSRSGRWCAELWDRGRHRHRHRWSKRGKRACVLPVALHRRARTWCQRCNRRLKRYKILWTSFGVHGPCRFSVNFFFSHAPVVYINSVVVLYALSVCSGDRADLRKQILVILYGLATSLV